MRLSSSAAAHMEIGLPQTIGALGLGDGFDQRQAGVLPKNRVDAVDHEVARHLILGWRALESAGGSAAMPLAAAAEGSFSGAGWAGGVNRRLLNAAFVQQRLDQGLQILSGHQFGEFGQAALAVHQQQQTALQQPQTNRTILDFFLAQCGFCINGRRGTFEQRKQRHIGRFPGFKDALIKYFYCAIRLSLA